MANTTTPAQQGGTATPAQQQGQSAPQQQPQQGSQPIIRDWASI